MTHGDKKTRERILLGEFMSLSQQYDGYELRDREEPDFELRHNDSSLPVIGVEVTEYLSGMRVKGGSVNRKAEAICEALRSRIRDVVRSTQYNKRLGRRTGLLRFWKHGVVLGKQESEFISDLVQFNLEVGVPGQYEKDDLSGYPVLAQHVRRLWIHKDRNDLGEIPWACTDCIGGHTGVTPCELNGCLNGKAGLAARYRSNGSFDRVILLIAAAGFRISECAGLEFLVDDLIPGVQAKAQTLGFDEIHFYSRAPKWTRCLYPNGEWKRGTRNGGG